MRTMLMIAIVALPLSAPAIAQDGANSGKRPTTSAKSQERKYCLKMDDATGSRIKSSTVCKTKIEWAREGIDVDNLD